LPQFLNRNRIAGNVCRHEDPTLRGGRAQCGFGGCLTLTACSGSKQEAPSAGGNAEVGSTNDINPQDPANLQQGGNLRLALPSFPANFNPLHIDSEGTGAAMLRATMPRAFRIAPDGSTSVNSDYFTKIELTGTNPQVVTYTINPKAVWSDGTPTTWEDIASQIHATSGKDKAFAFASPNGSERVGSVTRGVDDRQAVITFAEPFGTGEPCSPETACCSPRA